MKRNWTLVTTGDFKRVKGVACSKYMLLRRALLITVVTHQTKSKTLHWPITTEVNNTMNQSDLKEMHVNGDMILLLIG